MYKSLNQTHVIQKSLPSSNTFSFVMPEAESLTTVCGHKQKIQEKSNFPLHIYRKRPKMAKCQGEELTHAPYLTNSSVSSAAETL